MGLGHVYADLSIEEALRRMSLSPDVEIIEPRQMPIRFMHRALPSGDIYFLNATNTKTQNFEISLRTEGKRPEIWRADEQTITPVSYHMENGRTIVSLTMEPNDAIFVVLREPAVVQSAVVEAPESETLMVLNGPWELTFPPNLGAPARATFDDLHSWTQSPESGIRYFSGTATYTKSVHISPKWLRTNSRLMISLGVVKNLAEVGANGRSCGVLWKPPFIADVTECLKSGANILEIRVTNLWPNRLIGDRQSNAQRIAFAAYDPFEADSPLLPSGLLGPVTLTQRRTSR
jgi:hypothetical protein